MSTCEACGRRNAMYVCSSCGRKVCGICFNTDAWACYECMKVPKPSRFVWFDPFLWVIVGFLIFFIGAMLITLSTIGKIATTVGGAIFIGPIPIIFGAGPYSLLVILIVVLIAAFMLAWVILYSRKFLKG